MNHADRIVARGCARRLLRAAAGAHPETWFRVYVSRRRPAVRLSWDGGPLIADVFASVKRRTVRGVPVLMDRGDD